MVSSLWPYSSDSSKFRPLNTTASNSTPASTTSTSEMNSPSTGTSPLSTVSVNDSSLTSIQTNPLSHQVNPLTVEDVQTLNKLSSCQTNFMDTIYYRNHPLFHHISPYHPHHPLSISTASNGYFSATNNHHHLPPPPLTSDALIGSLGADPLAAYRAKMTLELLREGLVRNLTRQQSPMSSDWYRVPLSHITS